MSEVTKVKLSQLEIEEAYLKIRRACQRFSIDNEKITPTQSIEILNYYYGGKEPIFDINEPILNFQGWTPLITTTYFKHIEETKFLLTIGAKPDVEIQGERLTALHIAANNGVAVICKYLLNYGINVDHQSAKLITPLMRACQAGSYDVVTTLISAKPNIKLRDIDNLDCIDHAQKNNNSNLIRYIQYSYLSKELDVKDSRRSVGKI